MSESIRLNTKTYQGGNLSTKSNTSSTFGTMSGFTQTNNNSDISKLSDSIRDLNKNVLKSLQSIQNSLDKMTASTNKSNNSLFDKLSGLFNKDKNTQSKGLVGTTSRLGDGDDNSAVDKQNPLNKLNEIVSKGFRDITDILELEQKYNYKKSDGDEEDDEEGGKGGLLSGILSGIKGIGSFLKNPKGALGNLGKSIGGAIKNSKFGEKVAGIATKAAPVAKSLALKAVGGAAAGVAVGAGTKWALDKMGADKHVSGGVSKMAGFATAGAVMGGPIGAAVGAAIGGAVSVGQQLVESSKQIKKQNEQLSKYTLEEIKAGKATKDKNIEYSDNMWDRAAEGAVTMLSKGWNAIFDREKYAQIKEDEEKRKAARLAKNEELIEQNKNRKITSIDQLKQNKEYTLSQRDKWSLTSKSGREVYNSHLESSKDVLSKEYNDRIKKSIEEYEKKTGTKAGYNTIQQLANKRAKEMEKEFGFDNSDIRKLANKEYQRDNFHSTPLGQLFYAGKDITNALLTKSGIVDNNNTNLKTNTSRTDDSNTTATNANTLALDNLANVLTDLIKGDKDPQSSKMSGGVPTSSMSLTNMPTGQLLPGLGGPMMSNFSPFGFNSTPVTLPGINY